MDRSEKLMAALLIIMTVAFAILFQEGTVKAIHKHFYQQPVVIIADDCEKCPCPVCLLMEKRGIY